MEAATRIYRIILGLVDLIKTIKHLKIKSVAIPPLGCGNGKLAWPTVRKLIIDAIEKNDNVNIKIIEPKDYKNTLNLNNDFR